MLRRRPFQTACGSCPGLPERAILAGFSELTQASECAAENPRYLHLRYADRLGDLRLGKVFRESERQHPALARRVTKRSADSTVVIVDCIAVGLPVLKRATHALSANGQREPDDQPSSGGPGAHRPQMQCRPWTMCSRSSRRSQRWRVTAATTERLRRAGCQHVFATSENATLHLTRPKRSLTLPNGVW